MRQLRATSGKPVDPPSMSAGPLAPSHDLNWFARSETGFRIPSRLDLHVIGRILSALVAHGGSARPTQLQCSALVNYGRFEGYISLLQIRRLVNVDHDATSNPWITITPLGREAEMSICKWMRYLEEGEEFATFPTAQTSVYAFSVRPRRGRKGSAAGPEKKRPGVEGTPGDRE